MLTKSYESWETGDETQLPAKYVICEECEGTGGHSRDLGCITSSEWGNDWDYDEQDAYMRGDYDRACEYCDGTGKILEYDFSRMPAELAAEVQAQAAADLECDMIQRAEIRAGA